MLAASGSCTVVVRYSPFGLMRWRVRSAALAVEVDDAAGGVGRDALCLAVEQLLEDEGRARRVGPRRGGHAANSSTRRLRQHVQGQRARGHLLRRRQLVLRRRLLVDFWVDDRLAGPQQHSLTRMAAYTTNKKLRAQGVLAVPVDVLTAAIAEKTGIPRHELLWWEWEVVFPRTRRRIETRLIGQRTRPDDI